MAKLTKYWHLIILIAVILMVSWPLTVPGYFSHHDDLQIMRIFEMRKCFTDGQIPCRWVPDMGYGNGFPLFNYYSAFPYYLGAILSLFFGYIGAAKLLFFIPIIVGGLSMYLLGKELFGKNAGLVSAVLYIFAPYKALDLYVRGAIAESFAIALAPLIFYFSLVLIKRKTLTNFLWLAFPLAAFLTTHNISTMLFVPFFVVWVVVWVVIEKSKNIFAVIVSLLLGFGMSAFFIIPALFEKSLVQSQNLIILDFDYRAHFATISQLLFNRNWGYGASIPGNADTLSIQIGWPYWWLVIFLLILLSLLVYRKNLFRRIVSIPESLGLLKTVFLAGFLVVVFLTSVVMIHNKSSFIWESIPILAYVQFPWRFLSLTIFSSSLLGGMIIIFWKEKVQYVLVGIIVASTIVLNAAYFKPEFFYPLTDQQKLSGALWEQQQKAAILDYLPVTAVEPNEPAPNSPLVRSGAADVSNFVNQSNKWVFNINVSKEAVIEVPVFDFPGWEVQANNKNIITNHNNYVGRISFDLSPGQYSVVGRFKDTPVRLFSNIISIFSLIIIIGIVVYKKKRII